MALVQGEGLEAGQGVGRHQLRPHRVAQTLHKLEVGVAEAGVAMTTDRVAVEVVGSIEVAMIEVTEEVMMIDEEVMTMVSKLVFLQFC